MREYLIKIYSSRYFWIHLAKAELKYKFRRSKLGIIWTFLNPLLLTVLMTVIFGTVFNMSYSDYAPYILSGIIFWELVSSSVIGGGYSILGSEAYIRQCSHPIIIYPLKSAIVSTISFLISMIGLTVWIVIINPENLLLGIITLPLTTILYFFISWGLIISASLTNTKYRDYPQVMALVMQALWYVSPVFFRGGMFRSNKYIETFFYANPITHALNLIRKPFLYSELPGAESYLYMLVIIVITWIVAYYKLKKHEKEIIFYL